MAWEQPCYKPSGLVSSADLSAKQYYLVKIHTVAGQVAESTVTGEVVIGALQNKPTSGQAAEVMQSGITPLVASAAISAGDKLMAAGTTGKVATATGSGKHIIGQALEAASGDGVTFTGIINCGTGVV